MFQVLYSNKNGEMKEETGLEFLGRTGSQWAEPESADLIPIPEGSSLVMIPGHFPVGIDNNETIRCLDQTRAKEHLTAVAALLPQGFTRTLLPATVAPQGTAEVPLLGYTAVASRGGQVYVAAVQTDEHRKWHPCHYNTVRLEEKIKKRLARYPDNRILRQLANCSLNYSCFTAQNIFYERWEGGIPTSQGCNARCLGCISKSHSEAVSPQERLGFRPEVKEIVEIGLHHLEKAREGIISFGQGCEGEPALNAELLAGAIKDMRQATDQGCININTNAGYTQGIKKVVGAGLDSMRVTLLSADSDDYKAYHCPKDYSLNNVRDSIKLARAAGVYVSLNLLTMPGYTDSEEQVEKLLDLVDSTGVNMIQFRNLNLDPQVFFECIQTRSEMIGIRNMIEIFRDRNIVVGSYSHPNKRGGI